MLSVTNNMLANNANRMLGIVRKADADSKEKLSSGYRINRAADDAAGLAISEKMRKQIRGLTMGVQNSQDAVSLCQVADGALSEVHDMINRIAELSIKAANGTMSDFDRKATQDEVNQLAIEISRIGTTTTFNEIHIFDYGNGKKKRELIDISLIQSPSASVGFLSEVYEYRGQYYPSASMDFSALTDSATIGKLDGKTFSFACSENCNETFEFTFVRGDGNQSCFLNPETYGKRDPHQYLIDLQGAADGSQLVDILFRLVQDNPALDKKSTQPNSVQVSHSNVLVRLSDDKLVLRSNNGHPTSADAQDQCDKYVKNNSPTQGRVDFAGIANATEERVTNILSIHYGADAKDTQNFYIEEMNARVLGLIDLNVTTRRKCFDAIDRTKKATETINRQRALIGAQQNRYEHTIINEDNVIENLTASESRIRDTDMSKEIVRQSMLNVLQQAGQSVLSQSNQSNQGVLTLLQ